MVNHLHRLSSAVAVTVLCAMVIAGCSGNPHKITLIVVTPANQSLAVGQTQQYTAMATHHNGKITDITATATWKSSSTATATISTSGLATAVATGMTQITATQDQVTSQPASLTVTAALVSIAVTPNQASVKVGAQQQFTATGTYSDNSHQDITAQVMWNSQTTAVATITSPGGLATGVVQGSSAITATLGAIVSPAVTLTVTSAGGVSLVSVTVSPASPTIAVGQTVDFVATAHYSDSTTQVVATATWNTDTPATASILSPSGVAIALAAGSTGITATFNGVTSTPADTLTVVAAVAKAVYASGTTDGISSTFILDVVSTNLFPIGSGVAGSLPSQVLPEPSGRFAFYLQGGSISTYTLDPVSGRGTAQTSSLSTGVNAAFGAVDPTGQYLYVASTFTLDSYLINLSDGSLSRIGASGIAGFSNLGSLIVDRTGKYVYALDSGANEIFAYSIGAGGVLTPLATPSYATGSQPQYPAIDITNTYLYVPNLSDNSVSGYKINSADGSLTSLGAAFTGGGLNGPTFPLPEMSNKFLYVTNAGNNTISGLSLDASTGALSAGTTTATGNAPQGIAIDPSNTTVLVANVFGNTISVYSLNAATGALTPATLPQVESPAGTFFLTIAVGTTTPTVNPGAVYALNPGSNDISAFTSAAGTGALTAAAGSPFVNMTANSFAATDVAGSLLFTGSATGARDNTIGGFDITQSSAALTALTNSPFAIGAGMAADVGVAVYAAPTDNNVYTLDSGSSSVVQNQIASSSVVTPGSSTPAFVNANNFAGDAQGDFVYVLGDTHLTATNGIQPYTTYGNSGNLSASTQTTAPAAALPGNWTSGSVDGSGQFLVTVDSNAKSLQTFMITPAGTGSVFPGPDGTLIAIGPAGTVALTGGPWVATFDPLDRVVFVADQGAGTVTPYPFTFATGALGAAGTVTNVSANGITNIAVDITGTYLYVGVKAAAAPGSKGAVAVYSISAGGALTAVAGSPFTTGTGNPGIAVTNVVQ